MRRKRNLRKEIVGRLDAKGKFGFVVPLDGKGYDLFVRRNRMGGAMNGDLVRARFIGFQGRLVGEVVEVLERSTDKVVGTLEGRPDLFFVVPVGGGEAVRIRKSPPEAATGLRALVRITRWPDNHAAAEGEVLEVLGPAGEPKVELQVARLVYRVPGAFPEAVRREAEAVPEEVPAEALAGRRDLRHLETFTIDPPDARDYDDAVSLEEAGGVLRLGVHIADVAWAVREGTALDEEAYRRGTSTYLADGVVPMLPFSLSAGFCSLLPGADRLTASVCIDVTPDGEVLGAEIVRSVIRSRRRFTYDEVDEILGGKDDPHAEVLRKMERLAKRLFARREARGAIDLDIPEVRPVLDAEGKVMRVEKEERTWSHRLIEEFMILANEVVGWRLAGGDRAGGDGGFSEKRRSDGETARGIWRVHEPPDPKKLASFRLFLKPLGHRLPEGELRPAHFQALLDRVADSPEAALVSTMLLRSMQQARYEARPKGHFGLGAAHYSHFTSPIRRYADLLAHRLILGEGTKRDLDEASAHISERERAAEEVEYEDLKIRLMEYALDHVGEELDGVVTGVTNFGLFVRIFEALDGLVRIGELDDDYYLFDEARVRLLGRRTGKTYRLGQTIHVVLARVDIARREVDLVPAD